MKKHIGFILFFSVAIFIFLGRLIFMKFAFLGGDYLVQFYPWSKLYSEAIKNFSFPFWARYINSGFPLMAEGQIGGFYPLNIVLFFLLPLNVAYNYSIILHFILAGIFTYIYARKIGICQWGSALSALIFCFGSNYAGCPYLRTLVWFPLGLFIIEKYFEHNKLRYSLYLGIVLGVQLLAGFAQMAIYSAFFYLVYIICGLYSRKIFKISDIIKTVVTFLIAVVIFWPQLILTFKMAGLSMRTQGSLGFALWGSFNPLNLISFCFPEVIIYGAQFYIGIFTLLFFFFSLRFWKTEVSLRPILIILLVSFFLALGAYNPLYAIFLKITHFYSFRNPSKFIFFSCFAAAILSGWGFTQFFKIKDIKDKSRILNTTALFIGISAAIVIFTSIVIRLFKAKILKIGEWYVINYIFGKTYHRNSLDIYFWRVTVFYDQLLEATSLSNIFTLVSLVVCIAAIFIFLYLSKAKRIRNSIRVFFIIIISAELFITSFYGAGIGVNIKSFNYLKPTHNKILGVLQQDKSLFRIMPFWFGNGNMPWWTRPSANIIVGIDSIAAYSPLVQKSYKDILGPLEVVDDSLGVLYPSSERIKEKYNLLRLLNVKYLISAHKVNFDFLEEQTEEDGAYLYKFKDFLPRTFFVSNLDDKPSINQDVSLSIKKYNNGYIEIDADCVIDGFVVFSENYYPTWDVYVDGLKKENIKFANLIQAVAVSKGKHKVIFKYRPFYKITARD